MKCTHVSAQECLRLRSENSKLQHQMVAKDNMLQSKDNEILRLLSQIASDMVKRSDKQLFLG